MPYIIDLFAYIHKSYKNLRRRGERMGVATWETRFVVYTELRLDAYESNATRGVIKMITHAATGCSKWDSASL